jgi:hypothetical protein
MSKLFEIAEVRFKEISEKAEWRNESKIWSQSSKHTKQTNKTSSVAWVREQTIPDERPPLVGEVSANFCG